MGRCCAPCNQKKAALENDLSAILLQPSAFGEFPTNDTLFASEASRKGTARHPMTGKAVRDSTSELSVSTAPGRQFGITAHFTAPPTIDRHRSADLAWHHVTAFSYFVTYDQTMRSGRMLPGTFDVLDQTLRTDWGNDVQRRFAAATDTWELMFGVRTAGGFFKAVMRKHPSAHCLAWALEWNMNLRLVGMFGNAQAAEAFVAEMPRLQYQSLASSPGERFRYRFEQPIEESEDRLFQWDDAPAQDTS